MKKNIFTTLVFILTIFGLILAFGHGANATIDNRDVMLCESAKVSGNREYLKKCECYYSTNNISCTQGGDTQ